MPCISEPINETYCTITRRVAMAAVSRVLNLLGLKEKEIYIVYPGENRNRITPGAEKDSPTDTIRFDTTDTAYVTVSERSTDYDIVTRQLYATHNQPCFRDDALQVYLRPVYGQTDMILNFRYRAKDKFQAQQISENVRTFSAAGRAEVVAELAYEYPIPEVMIIILSYIHQLREQVAPYGDDISTYFSDKFNRGLTYITTLAGEHPYLVISETQGRVIGAIDDNDELIPSPKGNEDATEEIEFTFTLKYNKPVRVVMDYPVSIHNQLLPVELLNTKGAYQYRDRVDSETVFSQASAAFTLEGKTQFEVYSVIRTPYFDEWLPQRRMPNAIITYAGLVGVDLDDPTLIVDLTAFDTRYALKPEIIDYMKANSAYLTDGYFSHVVVALYQWGEPIPPSEYTIDDNLVMRANEPLNPRNIYHLCIGVAKDLHTVSENATRLLRHNPPACYDIIGTNTPALADRDDYLEVVNDSIVSIPSYRQVVKQLHTTRRHLTIEQYRTFRVNSLFITVCEGD